MRHFVINNLVTVRQLSMFLAVDFSSRNLTLGTKRCNGPIHRMAPLVPISLLTGRYSEYNIEYIATKLAGTTLEGLKVPTE